MNNNQYQLPKKFYFSEKYLSTKRWLSYWHQIKEVLNLAPQSVLEIGVGNKIVSNFIRIQNINIKTIDVNLKLEPDFVGSVLDLPFKNNEFDVVLCAEVLEHLPFEKFRKALEEINRVSKKHVVLSLPHWGISLYFGIKLPLLKKLEIFIKLPFYKKHKFMGEHYWEIGKRGYPLRKIKGLIKQAGLEILKDYLVFEVPYHHYFILRKQ